MTDQELKELVASLAIESKKTDEQLRKTDEQLRKTDEQIKKTDEQIKKTDEELRNLFKKVDERLDRVAKQLGNISNNQGDVAEEYFVNSLKDTLKIGQLNFDYILANFKIEGKNIKDEYDILLVNGESVAIVEVKYKVHPNDLEKLHRKINNLKSLPQYKGYKIYAGIAGFYVPDEVIESAKERGYFVLQRKGDIVVSHIENLKVA